MAIHNSIFGGMNHEKSIFYFNDFTNAYFPLNSGYYVAQIVGTSNMIKIVDAYNYNQLYYGSSIN